MRQRHLKRPNGTGNKRGGPAELHSDEATGLFQAAENTAANAVRKMDFFALKLIPARFLAKPGLAVRRAAWPAVYQTSDGAQVASPQSPILR